MSWNFQEKAHSDKEIITYMYSYMTYTNNILLIVLLQKCTYLIIILYCIAIMIIIIKQWLTWYLCTFSTLTVFCL